MNLPDLIMPSEQVMRTKYIPLANEVISYVSFFNRSDFIVIPDALMKSICRGSELIENQSILIKSSVGFGCILSM